MSYPTTYLPSTEFDAGTQTASQDILQCMHQLQHDLFEAGLDLDQLCHETKMASAETAPELLERIHDAAALLFLRWTRLRQSADCADVLATARLFNGQTKNARFLHERFDLIDTSHIAQFKRAVEQCSFGPDFDPLEIAAHMDAAAKRHTHENAWPWVVLPTFPRQPYGRILLFKVDISNFPHPIFVTQPFFLSGKSTLFHTHGQNWAYSRPLGPEAGCNLHINTLWMPKAAAEPFPLNLLDRAEYCSGTVAVMPPRVIHGISRQRTDPQPIPTIAEMLDDAERCQSWINQTRFGEQSCLHVYCPDLSLHQELQNSPYVQENSRFFIEYDMIVYDHLEENIWSGGGGSWPRRMIEFGSTGDHCGICFEKDKRKENLDPTTVYNWFIESPPPPLIKYSA